MINYCPSVYFPSFQHHSNCCCSKYIMLPTNMTEDDTFTYVMDQDYLDEGYYQLQAKLAMVTRFPKLVDLDGKGLVVQVKEAGSST